EIAEFVHVAHETAIDVDRGEMVGILNSQLTEWRFRRRQRLHALFQDGLLSGGDHHLRDDLFVPGFGEPDLMFTWRKLVGSGYLEVRGWPYVLAVDEHSGASGVNFSLQTAGVSG